MDSYFSKAKKHYENMVKFEKNKEKATLEAKEVLKAVRMVITIAVDNILLAQPGFQMYEKQLKKYTDKVENFQAFEKISLDSKNKKELTRLVKRFKKEVDPD